MLSGQQNKVDEGSTGIVPPFSAPDQAPAMKQSVFRISGSLSLDLSWSDADVEAARTAMPPPLEVDCSCIASLCQLLPDRSIVCQLIESDLVLLCLIWDRPGKIVTWDADAATPLRPRRSELDTDAGANMRIPKK